MLGVFESMYKQSQDGGQQIMHLLAFRRAAAHDDETGPVAQSTTAIAGNIVRTHATVAAGAERPHVESLQVSSRLQELINVP